MNQPGKIAVTPWLSRGRIGNYNDAVRLAEMTGQPADIAAVREKLPSLKNRQADAYRWPAPA